jgi:hypothetical protein
MYTSVSSLNEDSGDDSSPGAGGFMEMFKSPAHVDHMVRQAIQHCWAVLPKERRSVPEVEQQIRRMVERALKDFADDQAAFASANPDTK